MTGLPISFVRAPITIPLLAIALLACGGCDHNLVSNGGDRPGEPTAAFTHSDAIGSLPLRVWFDASASSDPDGEALSYQFDFGDGSVSPIQQGPYASHVYRSTGRYQVSLTVRDAENAVVVRKQLTVNVLHVDPRARGEGSGGSWAHAHGDLRTALERAAGVDATVEVWVAGGTYRPDGNIALPPGPQQVGPFTWAAALGDPEDPAPAAQAIDGTTSDARLLAGDAASGRLELATWQGGNQDGGRSFGAIALAAPAGRSYRVGLADWSLEQAVRDPADPERWLRQPLTQQDARLTVGYVADGAVTLEHGAASVLTAGDIAAPRVVVVLPFRHVAGGGSAWQLADHDGSPPEAGVWYLPPATGLGAAQRDEANRLYDLATILGGFAPDNGSWELDFRATGDGAWSLAVDVDGDGSPEHEVRSSQPEAARAPLGGADLSPLLLSLDAAGGNPADRVGHTTATLRWRDATAATPATPFTLGERVHLYGGFAGELAPADRDPANPPTIISGATGDPGHDDDFAQLLVLERDALLDRVTVSEANSAGSGAAPIRVSAATGAATIHDCRIHDHHSDRGAILLADGGLVLSASELSDNRGLFDGAGLLLAADTHAEVIDCVFRDQEAVDLGGAIRVEADAELTLSGSRFSDNLASDGAAINLAERARLTAHDCRFERNTAAIGFGGAIETALHSHLLIEDCVFADNASTEGAALRQRDHGTLELRGCEFRGNIAEFGGALYLWNLDSALIESSTFVDNQASDGAAAIVNGGTVAIDDSRFADNRAAVAGGAIEAFNGAELELRRCHFTDNRATRDAGGALAIFGGAQVDLGACTFTGNRSFLGGAVTTFASSACSAVDSLWSANHATFGGAWYSERDTRDEIVHCTFVGDVADAEGATLYVADGAEVAVTSSLLWPDASRAVASYDGAQDVIVAHSDVRGSGGSADWNGDQGTDAGGNLDQTPLLRDAAQPRGADGLWGTLDDGLAPLPESPLIDAGAPSLPADRLDLDDDGDRDEALPVMFDGATPRAIDTAPDIGAYEHLSAGG